MEVYLGVDWSATEVVCAVAARANKPHAIKGAKRTLEAVKEIIERVRMLYPEVEKIHVVIEAGAPGWVEMFHHAGAVVHVVDPKQAKAFAESLGSSGAKDDKRDAGSLAEMGRSRKIEIWRPRSELYQQLDMLSTEHEAVTADLTASKQRLRACLRERFPSLEVLLIDLGYGWVHRLLRLVPTPFHGRKMTRDQIAEAMRGSGARKESLERVYEAFAAGDAPWLTEAMARVQAQRVGRLVEQIALLSQQVASIEKELDQLTAELDLRHLLESVGGIAMKMAIRLIVFGIGLDEVPEDRDPLGILLGASPVFRGSGKDRKGQSKGRAVMRRAANHGAKSTTYLLGRQASLQLDWAAAMYRNARKRGQSAATAYRRIARCLLRILTAMVRGGQPYDNDRYVASLQRHGVAWGMELTTPSSTPAD
ncbi:MAG: hypothetical protein A3K19_11575 [Lentisphaerae bacterium RIFOXYB12_FULL_65_16]|nr:MAG: hypothetical protein A3K19_11575 [Lentisphaerae bacterium RIFOXYB12_FULL_65_16]